MMSDERHNVEETLTRTHWIERRPQGVPNRLVVAQFIW